MLIGGDIGKKKKNYFTSRNFRGKLANSVKLIDNIFFLTLDRRKGHLDFFLSIVSIRYI